MKLQVSTSKAMILLFFLAVCLRLPTLGSVLSGDEATTFLMHAGSSWESLFLSYLGPNQHTLFSVLSTSYILINSDLGTDEAIIGKIKEILDGENNIQYEIQGVYGVYDIILKLSSDDIDTLRSTITNKIRKITSVQSTLTMMVIEGQE